MPRKRARDVEKKSSAEQNAELRKVRRRGGESGKEGDRERS